MWKPYANVALKGPPKARQALRHISKKMALLNGRANQVVRRWSRQGDRNKPVLSREARGVRSTTFDIGPMSEVPRFPTCRGQRPAPAYIRLLSSRPTLCAKWGALGGLVGVVLRHQPQAVIGLIVGGHLRCVLAPRAGHLRFVPGVGPGARQIVGHLGALMTCLMHVHCAKSELAGRSVAKSCK